jgi:hypothetical protein
MIVIIVLFIGSSAFGFYYVQDKLNTFATSVGQTIAESVVGGTNTQAITKLQAKITEIQPAADKANTLTTSSQDYQNQMVKDLNKYAANTGITITDYNFTVQAPAGAKSASIGGAGTGFITISLGNPIPFANLMKFLKSIESNIPKMQISGINLSRSQSPANSVTVEALTIAVYTR